MIGLHISAVLYHENSKNWDTCNDDRYYPKTGTLVLHCKHVSEDADAIAYSVDSDDCSQEQQSDLSLHC